MFPTVRWEDCYLLHLHAFGSNRWVRRRQNGLISRHAREVLGAGLVWGGYQVSTSASWAQSECSGSRGTL